MLGRMRVRTVNFSLWLSQGLCIVMTWEFWSLSTVFHLSVASRQLLQQNSSIKKPAPQGSQLGWSMQFPTCTRNWTPSQTCVLSGGGHLITSQKHWIKSSYQKQEKLIWHKNRIKSNKYFLLITSDGLNSFCMQMTQSKKMRNELFFSCLY